MLYQDPGMLISLNNTRNMLYQDPGMLISLNNTRNMLYQDPGMLISPGASCYRVKPGSRYLFNVYFLFFGF